MFYEIISLIIPMSITGWYFIPYTTANSQGVLVTDLLRFCKPKSTLFIGGPDLPVTYIVMVGPNIRQIPRSTQRS